MTNRSANLSDQNLSNRNLSNRSAAVVTGISLVLMALTAIFSFGFALDALILPQDPAATVENIQQSEAIFRMGIGGWMLILLLDVVVAWGLYLLLRPVNQSLSLLTAWLRVVYGAILGVAILNLVGVLPLISDSAYTNLLGAEQVQALIMLRLDAFFGAWQTIGLVVFGVHLLLLGYLVSKSGDIPKVIGFLIMLAAIGYIVTNGGNLLLPRYADVIATIETVFTVPMIAGEVGLGLWLLVKGGRSKRAPEQKQTVQVAAHRV